MKKYFFEYFFCWGGIFFLINFNCQYPSLSMFKIDLLHKVKFLLATYLESKFQNILKEVWIVV